MRRKSSSSASASGLRLARFAFEGFLPRKAGARARRVGGVQIGRVRARERGGQRRQIIGASIPISSTFDGKLAVNSL